MSDCEGCPPEDVSGLTDINNDVVTLLGQSITALDDRYNENTDDPIYRGIRSKILATLKYTKARI